MKEVHPVISKQTTIWRAGLGFHASHSLGAILFGLMFGYLAMLHPTVLFESNVLLALGFAYLAAMTALAKLYWFSVPFRGVALSLVLYVAGVATSAA